MGQLNYNSESRGGGGGVTVVVMKMVLLEEVHRQVNIITPALLFIRRFDYLLVDLGTGAKRLGKIGK